MNAPVIVQPEGLDMVRVASFRTWPVGIDPSEIVAAEIRRDSLLELSRALLPIEAASEKDIKSKLRLANDEVFRLKRHKKIVEFSEGEYRLLDLAPLRWRSGENGWPIFAMFRVEGNHNELAGFKAHSDRKGKQIFTTVDMIPIMPAVIKVCFMDIMERIKVLCEQTAPTDGTSEATLLTSFAGLIPNDVRVEYLRAKASGLFSHLFIIAEVVAWKLNALVTSRRGDPLLVGIDLGGDPWLMKAFDTTEIENLVVEKFVTTSN